MLEELLEIVENLISAAIFDANFVTIVHVGESARYVAFDAEARIVFGKYMAHGEETQVPRTMRLLIEPIDRVRMRPLIDMLAWTVQ